MEEKSYGAAVDMWSLGVIVYILVTGAMPRDLWKSALKYGRVAEADFGFDCYEWDTVSEAARDFVRRCLTHDPKRRLSAADALEHPWMKKVSNVRPAPLRIKSQLRDFAKGMKLPTRTYQKGDVLIKQGERATDEVFLIKSGKVNIVVTDHATEERVLVATRETGEFVGEMSVGSAALTRAESAGSTGVEGSSKKRVHFRERRPRLAELDELVPGRGRRRSREEVGGKRRTADVVRRPRWVPVLGRKEMEWAITHDETIKNELAKDIDERCRRRRSWRRARAPRKDERRRERRRRTSTSPRDEDVDTRARAGSETRVSRPYRLCFCVYYEGPTRGTSRRRVRATSEVVGFARFRHSMGGWGGGFCPKYWRLRSRLWYSCASCMEIFPSATLFPAVSPTPSTSSPSRTTKCPASRLCLPRPDLGVTIRRYPTRATSCFSRSARVASSATWAFARIRARASSSFASRSPTGRERRATSTKSR